MIRSVWWRIGRWLGIVTETSWMAWVNRTSMDGRTEKRTKRVVEIAKELIRDNNAQRILPHRTSADDTTGCFLRECRNFAIDAIIDVGARSPDFGEALRRRGYRGQIVSFGSSSEQHPILATAASSDPLWDISLGCVLGSEAREARAEDEPSHTEILSAQRCCRGREPVPNGPEPVRKLVTLDQVINQSFLDRDTIFALQIHSAADVKGLLAGAKYNIERIRVLRCSMPLPASSGRASEIPDAFSCLDQQGYKCIAVGPDQCDPHSGEVVLLASVFVRRCWPAKAS
jgi:hypothetical protein